MRLASDLSTAINSGAGQFRSTMGAPATRHEMHPVFLFDLHEASATNFGLAVGRQLDPRAISSTGQDAILLPRNIDQFHQQEISGDAHHREDCQTDQNDNTRQSLIIAVLARRFA
jgi:hypothetical protein